MLLEEREYIVKAQDLDVEIEHSINDKLGYFLDIKIIRNIDIALFFILLTIIVLVGKDMIATITLPYTNKFESEIKAICESFITNKDIENGIQLGYGYFDVRDDMLNKIVSKKSKRVSKNIMLILFLIIYGVITFLGLAELAKSLIS